MVIVCVYMPGLVFKTHILVTLIIVFDAKFFAIHEIN